MDFSQLLMQFGNIALSALARRQSFPSIVVNALSPLSVGHIIDHFRNDQWGQLMLNVFDQVGIDESMTIGAAAQKLGIDLFKVADHVQQTVTETSDADQFLLTHNDSLGDYSPEGKE